MSALDHLRALAAGDAPADDGLLGNARCGWGGAELVGEESILAAFCATPFFLDADLLALETPRAAALVGRRDALVAAIYDGRIGRLWRVGLGVTGPVEPAISVAFDPDMSQLRGDVSFRPEDHPELDAAGADRLLVAARAHLDAVRRQRALRVRAFVLRAFGSADRSVALLAVHAMTNEVTRVAGFSYAVLGLGAPGEPARVVAEETPPRPWTPRFSPAGAHGADHEALRASSP